MIRGTLTEFSLPELVRLVSETHKTGLLEVTGSIGSGQLLFLDGCICGSRTGAAREPLGRKLVRAGAITERDVWKALDQQSRVHQRLGQLLISDGAVSNEQVQSALREQIEDGAVDILALEPTHFMWRPDPPQEQGPVLIPPESFLSAVSERAREIDQIRARIPADEAVVSITPAPPGEASDVTIGRDEWRMLSLLGTRRPVRDLMQYSGAGEIHTLRALDALINHGLLELGPPATRQPRPSQEHTSAKSQTGSAPPRKARDAGRVIRLSEGEGAASSEPFTVAIVATSNRYQSLLGAAVLRRSATSLPVKVDLYRLDDLGPVAPSAEALLRADELGVDLASHPARQLRREELRTTDLVVGLDWWHVDRAVLYGAAAREKAFTVQELLDLLPQTEGITDPRLVARARARVKGAHEKRLGARGDHGVRAAAAPESGGSDNSSDTDTWPLLASLLFSVDRVGETS
jgi:protein-tyrosine-phosphatase